MLQCILNFALFFRWPNKLFILALSVDACFFQVNGIYGTLDERYEALNRRVTALETQKEAEATESAGASG